MYIVSMLSQKGGTGKTTLSLHLAVASERAGQRAVVIDLDPQASSAEWKDSRAGDTPVVVPIPSSRLPHAVPGFWIYAQSLPLHERSSLPEKPRMWC